MDGGFKDWLASLSRRELVLVVVVGLLVAGGAGLWYARSLPRPVAVQATRAPAPASPSPAELFVHVAGWVREPGVYRVRQGDRVIDAIELAGGPKHGAQVDALNLAAVLTDGQQVMVPGPSPPSGSGLVPVPGATPGTALVNVNSASVEELETLPGIGPVLAGAIIEFREQHGPFTAIEQLEEVSGIGPATLEEIRDLVTV